MVWFFCVGNNVFDSFPLTIEWRGSNAPLVIGELIEVAVVVIQHNCEPHEDLGLHCATCLKFSLCRLHHA